MKTVEMKAPVSRLETTLKFLSPAQVKKFMKAPWPVQEEVMRLVKKMRKLTRKWERSQKRSMQAYNQRATQPVFAEGQEEPKGGWRKIGGGQVRQRIVKAGLVTQGRIDYLLA